MRRVVLSSFPPESSPRQSSAASSVASYWSLPLAAPANSTHCACLNAGEDDETPVLPAQSVIGHCELCNSSRVIGCRSFETQLSRVEAELLRREAPPSYGQLIAQGLIPPVEDFPVCSGSQVHIHCLSAASVSTPHVCSVSHSPQSADSPEHFQTEVTRGLIPKTVHRIHTKSVHAHKS